jgi:hypothetical protein
METIGDAAKNYKAKGTLTVADLENGFSIQDPVFEATDKTKEGKEYTYKFIMVNDTEYRVPYSVLSGIKSLLEKRPNTTSFEVLKSGEGTETKYQVIPKTN